MKMESEDSDAADSSQTQPVELTTTPTEHRHDIPNNSSEPLSLPPPPHVCIVYQFFYVDISESFPFIIKNFNLLKKNLISKRYKYIT